MSKQQTQELVPASPMQLALPDGYEATDMEAVQEIVTQRTAEQMLAYDRFHLIGYEMASTRYGERIVWNCLTEDGKVSFSVGVCLDSHLPQYGGKMNQERLALMAKFDANPKTIITNCALIELPVQNGNPAYRIVSAKERDLQDSLPQRLPYERETVRLPDISEVTPPAF